MTSRPVRAVDGEPSALRCETHLTDLLFESPVTRSVSEPVSVGIPFPRGAASGSDVFVLRNAGGEETPVQTEVLAHWPDGSAKWVLLTFLANQVVKGESRLALIRRPSADPSSPAPDGMARQTESTAISAGSVLLSFDRSGILVFKTSREGSSECATIASCRWSLVTENGARLPLTVAHTLVESAGPVKTTVVQEGGFRGSCPCRYSARISVFRSVGLIRVDYTLHNPRAARHRGGLWDLGDPGSYLFQELAFEIQTGRGSPHHVRCLLESDAGTEPVEGSSVKIVQESSGGANWRSRNHVGSDNRVPDWLRGYRVGVDGVEREGLRATPSLAMAVPGGGIAVTLAGFWQQFPKAMTAEAGRCAVHLFPRRDSCSHELQGGEQKTHTIWLKLSAEACPEPGDLAWAHEPIRVRAEPEWYEKSGVLPRFLSAGSADHRDFRLLCDKALDPSVGMLARREVIDEYGWRHYGEVFADHEGEHYRGPAPVISHYNNQYDLILGFLSRYFATGERRWYELFEPLARHVADIDIYHTQRDRAAYNGGLFWFTDHYLSAETATHRTYSAANRPGGGASYGGGPSSSHLFTRGLCQAYYVTGDPLFRNAVLELADWVLCMEDGGRTVLGLVDDGPTGLASATGSPDYHGPGRGAGNSLTALLDAWELTGRSHYLQAAEALIRRVVHPGDDVAAHDLLDVEKRWSYTVFLAALADYLRRKACAGAVDAMYGYAQESLRLYARWMLENERPYFDRREQLEYPTEAWPGQELRKANVLRLASAHEEEPLRSRMRERAGELADRAWRDLMSFGTRASARALALVLVEGAIDGFFRSRTEQPAPKSNIRFSPDKPVRFVPQRTRVVQSLKSPAKWPGLARRLLDLGRWRRWMLRRRRSTAGAFGSHQ
jgi:hypothetical protein